jgi:hypothetical protein
MRHNSVKHSERNIEIACLLLSLYTPRVNIYKGEFYEHQLQYYGSKSQ